MTRRDEPQKDQLGAVVPPGPAPRGVGGAGGVQAWVPGRPVTQGSMRHVGAGRMAHDNAGLKPWREAVGWAVRLAMGLQTPHRGPVALQLQFQYRQRRVNDWPDLDKLSRAVLDALVGVGYEDDHLVEQLWAARVVVGNPFDEGLLLQLWPLDQAKAKGALRDKGEDARNP